MKPPFDRDFGHPLPPQLMEAPNRFNAWSQRQLLLEQRAATPTAPLYHYTGEEALTGMLRNQRLWCFSHLHQSDPREFEYSLELARQAIREVGKSDDFWTHHFCGCLDDMLETNGLAGPFDFYLFSLSRHRDDPGQWREYGKAGHGFALGFAPSLLQPDQDYLNEQANENLHVGRVIYGNGETTARHRRVIKKAAAITSMVAGQNPAWLRMIRPVPYLAAMAREAIASQIIWNCLTAKEDRFLNEREVRGIIMGVRQNFDAHRKTLGTRAYVETPMMFKSPGSIAEILVGPLVPLEAEATVAALLKAEGYTYDIPILRSKAVL